MNNGLPKDWEPGQNHGWKPGHNERTRQMARGAWIFFILALLLITAAIASPGCINRGQMFEKGVFEKQDSIAHVAAAESVYWKPKWKGF